MNSVLKRKIVEREGVKNLGFLRTLICPKYVGVKLPDFVLNILFWA